MLRILLQAGLMLITSVSVALAACGGDDERPPQGTATADPRGAALLSHIRDVSSSIAGAADVTGADVAGERAIVRTTLTVEATNTANQLCADVLRNTAVPVKQVFVYNADNAPIARC